MSDHDKLREALWKVYRRPDRPQHWEIGGGNLPWNDPAFSERMLREHLDESHGAASRTSEERARQIPWLVSELGIGPDSHVLDVTCGPGLYAVDLAREGTRITGLDFAPASLAHARQLAESQNVAERCTFHEQDVRTWKADESRYDAALLLYGQLAVMRREEASHLLTEIASALRPGARLAVELLDAERVDKADSTWWFTDSTGLWGDEPFLHLGERFWDATEKISVERFQILHLETGQLDEVTLCDQSYEVGEMDEMLRNAGFSSVVHHENWGGIELYDSREWIVYVAER